MVLLAVFGLGFSCPGKSCCVGGLWPLALGLLCHWGRGFVAPLVNGQDKRGAHRRDPNDALLLMETEAMQQNKRVNDCRPMNARMCELHSSPLRWTWKPKARLTLMCTWFETLANNCLSTWTLHHVWWSGECLQGCTPKSQNCHFPTPLSPTPLSPQKRETWP